jgi:hypothetical protein
LILGAFLIWNADLSYTARPLQAQTFPEPAHLDR